ncbi:beta-galactosidase [bacterium A37T11]|nr:beta-galactosidase [bacterium A37T11]
MQKHALIIITACLFTLRICGQGIRYMGRFSPAEGLVKPQEKPYRDEICLNGLWDFQPFGIPKNWKKGAGIAPPLPVPGVNGWDSVPIKIPSPWNVNTWGGGRDVGPGTSSPYSPSSVYFPSYPKTWDTVQMGWLRKKFSIPHTWRNKRLVLHFEAVAGDAVVFINGAPAGSHFDSYLPFDLDITELAVPNKENEIQVGIRAHGLFDKNNSQYRFFSATYPAGSNTDGLIGIWQDVFLQALPLVQINDIFIKPLVDSQLLSLEIKLRNTTRKVQHIQVGGTVHNWINNNAGNPAAMAEISWQLGPAVLQLALGRLKLQPGETKKIILHTKVGKKLKYWSPSSPNLYVAQIDLHAGGKLVDRKTDRFGWRNLTIRGKEFYLNGQKIQAFGDLQHPFGAYICSRRFAWAWYRMIKDAGGNAVRPHAQPWPRLYYDLADEMGLLVLDETALFGSSIRLNFEEDITWKRSADHLKQLILRDRNHPSVVGWSIGNELFAIALLNKPDSATAQRWTNRIQALAQIPLQLDETRPFITCDGDEDLKGVLPVWSKHFGHGVPIDALPKVNKPLVVGESGATYYGKPRELYSFIGDKAYGSYADRSQALAIDLYQNMTQMAKPLLSWFSPSELCWFGIAPLNLGYHDFNRLPGLNDGVFAGLKYVDGQPGYQYERIPPYVSTFNPGLDPALPLYKPLPMFSAYQMAMGVPVTGPEINSLVADSSSLVSALPAVRHTAIHYAGDLHGPLLPLLDTIGIKQVAASDSCTVLFLDGLHPETQHREEYRKLIRNLQQKGGQIWVFNPDSVMDPILREFIAAPVHLLRYKSTALRGTNKGMGTYFNLRDLYFSEMPGDSAIIKYAMDIHDFPSSIPILSAARTDWSLFNGVAENRKCAQVVLYEQLHKLDAHALVCYPFGKAKVFLSTIDYRLIHTETIAFWKRLFSSAGIAVEKQLKGESGRREKNHDLLLDGPVSSANP